MGVFICKNKYCFFLEKKVQHLSLIIIKNHDIKLRFTCFVNSMYTLHFIQVIFPKLFYYQNNFFMFIDASETS